MKRYKVVIILILVLAVSTMISCIGGSQTFSKHDISFTVSDELKLEEYTANILFGTFRKGPSSYNEGAVLSSEKNFMLLWLSGPELTSEEVRISILSTPNVFISATLQAEITGDIHTRQIAGFDVTYADMEFSSAGWEAPGITAVWYCPASGRTFQVVLIHKQPDKEMRSFINSFTCS